MFNIGQKNKFSNTDSEMAGLFLIKTFIKKKPQPEAKTGKFKRTESKALSWKTLSNF